MQVNKLNKTLGVIGAGQLGKMIGLAAANLGINCCFYDPDKYQLKTSLSSFLTIVLIMKKN